jgi:hypothetical protein
VIFSKQFTPPFTVAEHEVVAVVSNITIRHVKKVDGVVQDYDQYANLLALKALYHVVHGQGGDAVAELTKLSALFDGYGFRDKAYNTSGKVLDPRARFSNHSVQMPWASRGWGTLLHFTV